MCFFVSQAQHSVHLGPPGIVAHIGPPDAVDLMELHDVAEAPVSEHLRMERLKQGCDRVCFDRGVEFSQLATIHRAQRPDKSRSFAEPAHMTASKLYQPPPHQEEAPTRPWKVWSSRATGISMYEVVAEVVEHKPMAIHHITRERWGHATADAQTWLRAPQLIVELSNIGIDPV